MNCSYEWKETIHASYVLNDYEHKHKGVIVHECQNDAGYGGAHECGCGETKAPQKRKVK